MQSDRALATSRGSAPIQKRWLGSRFTPRMSPPASRCRRRRVSTLYTSCQPWNSRAMCRTPWSRARAARSFHTGTAACHCQRRISSVSGGQEVTIHVGVRSSGLPPGRPLIITTVSSPSCSASRKVPSATARSRAPFSPGNRGLPEQFRAETVRPLSASVSSSRCRAPASAVSFSRSTWGAGDQLPQPSSTCSSPSLRQTAAASSRERSARQSVTKPSFIVSSS